MKKQIDELRGLKFSITVNEDGWVAECDNLPGIITGGQSHPSVVDIDLHIKDAIFAAFGIPAYLCDYRILKGPLDLEPKRSAIKEVQFVYHERLAVAHG